MWAFAFFLEFFWLSTHSGKLKLANGGALGIPLRTSLYKKWKHVQKLKIVLDAKMSNGRIKWHRRKGVLHIKRQILGKFPR